MAQGVGSVAQAAASSQGATNASSNLAIAAALDWWLTAGADTLVADEPRGWLKVPAKLEKAAVLSPIVDIPIARVAPRPAAMPTIEPSEDFSAVATLADLRALAGSVPFADGDPASGVMLLGEASAADDLRTLRPFSGPAGDLLDRMLAAIGLDRTCCYISNLCPRRPIAGSPSAEEIARDLPLTRAHIRLAKPRLLMLLGGPASSTLLGDRAPIGKLRGQWRELIVDGHPVAAMPMFNPAYLLRRPEDKRLAWADLRAFKARLHA